MRTTATVAGFAAELKQHKYNALRSYSHTADAKFAPALQASLGYGGNTGAWTTDMFVEAVYTSLKQTEK